MLGEIHFRPGTKRNHSLMMLKRLIFVPSVEHIRAFELDDHGDQSEREQRCQEGGVRKGRAEVLIVNNNSKELRIEYMIRTRKMKENEASFTALMTAYMRAYHSMHEAPVIFNDFLAYDLIPEEKRPLIQQYVVLKNQLIGPGEKGSDSDPAGTFSPLIQTPNALSRARYAEEALEDAVKQGIKQYVILGAGLDTFAFRRPDMMEQLDIFEVDHPASQEFKLHRLAELGWKIPSRLHFIPIDFTKEDLVTVLTRSSAYDPHVRSLFNWLGVTYYLTRGEVLNTLRSITSIAPMGSTVVFDYSDEDAFVHEKSSPEMKKKLEFFQSIGEPMITGFNPSTLADELSSLGFHLQENIRLLDVKERYFQGPTDKRHAQEYEYIARAVFNR